MESQNTEEKGKYGLCSVLLKTPKSLGSSGEIASACLWEFWEDVFRRLRICIWRFKDSECFVCVGGDRHYKDTLGESSGCIRTWKTHLCGPDETGIGIILGDEAQGGGG